jgi:uncharacterized protein YpmB
MTRNFMRLIGKTSNKSGIILMIVVIILMAMGVFAITIFSQSMSQTKTTHSQVDQIVLEQLGKGAAYKAISQAAQQRLASNTFNQVSYTASFTGNGHDYSATAVIASEAHTVPNVIVTVN